MVCAMADVRVPKTIAMTHAAVRRDARDGLRGELVSFDCAKTGRIEKFAVDCSTRTGSFRPEFV